MRQKFIKGTNKKYSIREDGVITRHWVKQFIKGKYIIIYKNVEHKYQLSYNIVRVKLRINNKIKYYNVKDLVYAYFIGNIPKNGLIKQYSNNPYSFVHNDLYLHLTKSRKEKDKLATIKARQNLSRKYIVSNLRLPSRLVTKELEELNRNTILLKRKLAIKHNLHIQSFQ